MNIWKSSTRLSDGREILYYDETPGTGRADVADTRGLPAPSPDAAGPGLRWDALAGEWVLVAAARQGRTLLPSAADCPLCPSAPGRATEIPADDYDVVVFQNRFPALPPGQGRCEVICYTADHKSSFAALSPRRARTVMAAWADRTAVLGALPAVRQVYCFENRGEQIGVSLHHPHGQVYALPFITPRTAQMLAQASRHERQHGGNLFDDLVAAEIAAGTRIVAANEHWTAFVPEAARWPYEVRFFPRRRVPDLPALDDAQQDAFGPLYLSVLRGLDRLFGPAEPLPYIAAWHQAPPERAAAAGDRSRFAAHLQVFSVQRAPGRLKYLAGTESGMGVWSNDVEPEQAARMIREAM